MSNGPTITESGSGTFDNVGQTRAPNFIQNNLRDAAAQSRNEFFGLTPQSGVNANAQSLVQNTLGGGFLGSNPALQGVANQIGDNVFNQTAQRFAGAGRNVGGPDAQGVFRQDLTNQLSPLFAQNFENERDRQMQSLGFASQFDPLNQFINQTSLLAPAAGRDTRNFGFTTSTGRQEEKRSPFDRLLGGVGSFFGG